ncbi:MAG: Lrp/AsnC family transcriptional regulator [archaeon]|nr:Lrp/AsnC family transcriptional regulator [archaeon]
MRIGINFVRTVLAVIMFGILIVFLFPGNVNAEKFSFFANSNTVIIIGSEEDLPAAVKIQEKLINLSNTGNNSVYSNATNFEIPIIFDDEVNEEISFNKNKIVVGGPCVNTFAADLLELEYPACGEAFEDRTSVGEGEFMINAVEIPGNESVMTLVIIGYDLEVAIAVKDVYKFEEVFIDFIKLFEGNLLRRELVHITQSLRVGALPNLVLKPLTRGREKSEKKMNLDRKDLIILDALSNDARMPLHEISSKANLSADAIGYRLRNLEHNGYISGYAPVFDYEAIGYQVYSALIAFSFLDEKSIKDLSNYVKSDPSVLWAARGIGSYNLIIYFAVKNPSEIHTSIKALKDLFPERIERYELLFAEEEYKYTYFPPSLGLNFLMKLKVKKV